MTTQPESDVPQPESGSTQPESGVTHSQYGESKEGKPSSSLSARWSWPRDLADMYGLGANSADTGLLRSGTTGRRHPLPPSRP